MDTTPERWQRIEQLIDHALDLPQAERDAWLRSACGTDLELYHQLTTLLEAGERPDAFLNDPIIDIAAGLNAGILPSSAPARVGSWRIVKELGQGGMGTVYLAEREQHFQQRVALKLIRRGLHADPQLLRRFLEERQILASLHHAHIAHVLDGGVTEDGVPWFAMEFVEGEPIDRWCDSRRLSIEARLELFGTACQAVEYAHQRQIIHRDLKPSNILVRADGVVKLLDFGVAKLLVSDSAQPNVTRAGLRLLTPEYASPEQVRGDPVSAASDVYSLGVLLYELLTGRRPYRVTGGTGSDVERAVLTQQPAPPSTVVRNEQQPTTSPAGLTPTELARVRGTTTERLSQRLRGQLDGIVLKALAKDAKQRYSSADSLARDVQRYLDGVPVQAKARPAWSLRAVAIVSIFVLALGAAGRAIWSVTHRPAPVENAAVIAVGLISDYREGAAAEPARALADLLSTSLARVPSLRIVSTARVYELMAQLGEGSADNAGAYAAAARRAGASLLLDGGLYTTSDGQLRLELRRIDVATGNVLSAESALGKDMFSLVDGATAWLANAVSVTRPLGSIADVTTHSEAAYQFYEAGMRAFYRADLPAARALLEAALAKDSMLAMAALYLSRSDPTRVAEYLEQAVRLAPRASDRERLIIESEFALRKGSPAAALKAETLAIRYPQEMTGHSVAGRALLRAGDYAGGLRRLRQVAIMDSVAFAGTSTPCRRCDVRPAIIDAYQALDSLAAAEREARSWAAQQPQSVAPWLSLAETLILQGKRAEALAASRQATAIDPGLDNRSGFLAAYHVDAGEFDILDTRLRELMKSAVPDVETMARMYLTISLRSQGRLAEALEMAREYRALAGSRSPQTPSSVFAVPEAQVLLELGRQRAAAAIFDTIANLKIGATPAQVAATRASWLVRVANATAALNDTSRLAMLADTIRDLGAISSWPRDQLYHPYVRGLLLARQGRDEQAIAEFRRAILSPTIDLPAQLQLARALLRLGRAREAVAALEPATHAKLLSVASTTTPTELQELLAQAWDAVGEQDSARVHYAAVARAWQRADPILRARVDAARARSAALR